MKKTEQVINFTLLWQILEGQEQAHYHWCNTAALIQVFIIKLIFQFEFSSHFSAALTNDRYMFLDMFVCSKDTYCRQITTCLHIKLGNKRCVVLFHQALLAALCTI